MTTTPLTEPEMNSLAAEAGLEFALPGDSFMITLFTEEGEAYSIVCGRLNGYSVSSRGSIMLYLEHESMELRKHENGKFYKYVDVMAALRAARPIGK
jgi:hypothetical protein